jgi:aspartyl-tRNA(Asn)/glutamyl-tRNA(Gln) amidotransferase subunit C
MTITTKEIQHIADLARLNLDKSDLERYQGQLSAILDYIAKLQNVVAVDMEETAEAVPNIQLLRVDDIKESLTNTALMQNSKNTEKKQFKIPPVFE